jgi:phage terminase large subunit-like protein
MWARGLAKSVTFDVFMAIWLHLFHDDLNLMVLISKNEPNAIQLLSDLRAEFEANPQLINDFGELKDSSYWAEEAFKTKKGGLFVAKGKKSPIRGLRNGRYRPDYIVLDDVDDDEEVLNPAQVDKSFNRIIRGAKGGMDIGTARFIIVNNKIANHSILTKFSNNPKYYTMRVDALQPDGTCSWSEKYTPDYYNDLLEEYGSIIFNSEYMNEVNVEGKIFVAKYFQTTKILPLKEYDRIVAWWDLAYSEQPTADFNAINIVGLVGNVKHILYTFCRRCKMEDAIRWSYMMDIMLGVNVEWYFESQFWNDAVRLCFDTVAQEMGYQFPYIMADRDSENKFTRIMRMLPTYQRMEVFYNEDIINEPDTVEGIAQIKAIEYGYKTKDDNPDSQSAAINILESGISTGGDDEVGITLGGKRATTSDMGY